MNATLVMDLLGSKKFKALLALVALWSEPVRASLGLDPYALKYLTLAFCVYFVAQSFRDFGEEANKIVATFRKEKDNQTTATDANKSEK